MASSAYIVPPSEPKKTLPWCTRGDDSLRLESLRDHRILPPLARRHTIRPLPDPFEVSSSVTYTRPSSSAGVEAERLPSWRFQRRLPVSRSSETSRALSASCRMRPLAIAGGNSVSAGARCFHLIRHGPRSGLAGSNVRRWSFV